jgi:hypothetical protein
MSALFKSLPSYILLRSKEYEYIQCRMFKFRILHKYTQFKPIRGMLVNKLTWNICRSSSATRLRRRIVAMVTAIVCGGSAGGGEAEPLGGAPWCSSMPYSMDTAPTSSVTWRVPTNCVGSSVVDRRRTLLRHLHTDHRALCWAGLSTVPQRTAPRHATPRRQGVRQNAHLTSALEEGERSASRSGRSTPGERGGRGSTELEAGWVTKLVLRRWQRENTFAHAGT